ncbi:MAG TPA: diguanylate cyclase [Pyrinomonadaceae bacterium]
MSWKERQDDLADKHGLAIVLTDASAPELLLSNNNSVCRHLYNSAEFAPECAKFCGKAFEWAQEANGAVEYKCYAGLSCVAVPIGEKTAAIVGRAFLKAEDYRNATERAIDGDWSAFSPTVFFENVLLSGSAKNLKTLGVALENLDEDEQAALNRFLEKTGEIFENEDEQAGDLDELAAQLHSASGATRRNAEEVGEIAAWRSLFGSLLNLSYEKAYQSILRFLEKRYSIADLAWLERTGNRLEIVYASGRLKSQQIQISIAADDEHLIDAVRCEVSLEFREKQNGDGDTEPQTIRLFPVAVGEDVWNALVVADEIADERVLRHIARFCHSVASELEILRLRGQLARRGWLERAVQRFNENLKNIDSDDFWSSLVQVSAELLKAERSSLLLFDEKSDSFVVKAATGARADIIKREITGLGERVASGVLQKGVPSVVADVNKSALGAAPAEWNYKTASFISYPVTVGTRKIGVLNVTDRADGGIYGESDLELLDAIAPQLGVLIDRVTLKHKAGEFEQLSVTDALTGLLNRRYLEERLTEEIKRSNRHGYPMSFMMIDVDYFKPYNDNFGHAEGDKALQIVGQSLKESLRGADIAARYGGEEFSILLPQTTPDEAKIIGERVREKVETTEFPNRKVTVSIGIASCSHIICTPNDIIRAADNALYEAKRKGRNNVQVYENLKE